MQVTDPYLPQNRKNLMWLAAGVLLLVAVSAFGIWSGWLLAFGRQPLMATTVEGTAPPSLSLDMGSQGPSVMLDPGRPTEAMHLEEAKTMPKSIYDWLKHLEKCEKARERLSMSQIGSLLPMASMGAGTGTLDPSKYLEDAMSGGDGETTAPEPVEDDTTKAKDKIEENRKAWVDLVAFFRTMPPPDECVEAAALYDECLTETQVHFLEIMDLMTNAMGSDPTAATSKLAEIYSSHKEKVDKPAGLTDEQVQQICDKYEVKKWFSVQSNYGGGLKIGMPSLPGF